MKLKNSEQLNKIVREDIVEIENLLMIHGINSKVKEYYIGPTIIRYEINVPKYVKIKRILELELELALNLRVSNVRIIVPVPGKKLIGIERENPFREPIIFLENFKENKFNGELPFTLGKNEVGEIAELDLVTAPHLLIAGTTGSGKSVFLNSILNSFILNKSENEVKLILIDPKMVEFMPYNDIKHLLLPVVVDGDRANKVLNWVVKEMDRRYSILAQENYRNIKKYNENKKEKLPYIVIFIDDLADIMLKEIKKEVEKNLSLIAQKSRAIGIHLVVATQRPSVDITKGVLKANFPTRISFSVRTKIDSFTILDQDGAEKLLGKGDYLLLKNGTFNLERYQSMYISDNDVLEILKDYKVENKVYDAELLEKLNMSDLNFKIIVEKSNKYT